MNASMWSQRMSLMTLNRSASTFRMAALPRTRRPSGSGPRAMRNVASSAKNVMMRSTSRLLNAALMSFMSAGVGPPAMVCVVIACPPESGPHRVASRPHGVHRRPRPSARRRQLGPLAEQAARVARIHDLLDPERLGRAERRAQLGEALLDVRHLRPRVGRRVDFRAIRRFDPAFERQRAPASRRPRVTRAVAAAVAMRGARYAEAVAHDDGAPRNRRLPDRRHRTHALLDGPGVLGVEPDQEAGTIDEIEQRQVERLRDVDKALDLLTRVRGPGA